MLLDCLFKQNRRQDQQQNSLDDNETTQRISRNSVQPIMDDTNNSDHNGNHALNGDAEPNDNNNFTDDIFNKIFYDAPGTTPILFFSHGEPKNVEEWSASLDNLLEDPIGIQTFFIHLKTEHSTENLRFWLACEHYKKCKPEKLKEQAKHIYNEFLSRRSKSQINVTCSLLKEVRKQLSKPSVQIFANVQHEIFNLMRTDSYPRFLKSEKYLGLLSDKEFSRST